MAYMTIFIYLHFTWIFCKK